MFNGGCEISQTPATVQSIENASRARQHAYVKILEQPAPKALRFRYECEGRSAGSIPGASSTPENKTYPSIQVVGYQGRAVVVVSCVTKDEPFKPHPHNLVGREGCKRGVCTLQIPHETMMIQFSNLGIQCVKKKDIEAALRVREDIRVDPFRTGFNHKNQPTTIDLNAVRLCFQVFLEGDIKGKFNVPLTPVVSEPIYDKKAMSDLIIVRMSDCLSYVDGERKQIILLCEKIAKEDIQVRFFEEKNNQVIWEDIADFQPTLVHKQVSITFRPPRYRNVDIVEPVNVLVQLRRPSDGATSEPVPFQYLPMPERKGKRRKIDSLLSLSQEIGITNDPAFLNIKTEPRENYQWPQGGIVNMSDVIQIDTNQFRIPGLQNMPSTSNTLPPLSSQPCISNVPSPGNVLPTLSSQSWNLPYLEPSPNQNVDTGNMEGILMDLDSHNMELRPIILNSGELELDAVLNLSETLNSNLSFADPNTTDSLTRLANNTIDSLCQGTNMFK